MKSPIDNEVDKLKYLLWLRHGCASHCLYGDDGEWQCHSCFIDFKRMSASEIEHMWTQQNLAKFTLEVNLHGDSPNSDNTDILVTVDNLSSTTKVS